MGKSFLTVAILKFPNNKYFLHFYRCRKTVLKIYCYATFSLIPCEGANNFYKWTTRIATFQKHDQLLSCFLFRKEMWTSTTPSCSSPIPAQNIWGVVLSDTMPKMDVYYSHHFCWKRTHLSYISHTMVTSIITSPLS